MDIIMRERDKVYSRRYTTIQPWKLWATTKSGGLPERHKVGHTYDHPNIVGTMASACVTPSPRLPGQSSHFNFFRLTGEHVLQWKKTPHSWTSEYHKH